MRTIWRASDLVGDYGWWGRSMCWWFRGWFEFAMVGTIWEEEVEVRQEGYTVEMMFMFLYASFYSSRVL